jgi:hypothetical protein
MDLGFQSADALGMVTVVVSIFGVMVISGVRGNRRMAYPVD